MGIHYRCYQSTSFNDCAVILAQIKALELKIISTGFHIMMMYTTPSKFSSDTVPDKTKLDTSTCLLISD
jgi:hypothetical protein